MAEENIETEVLERQLDRTHNFFPRIDAKVSALFAIVSAQTAVATLNLAPSDLRLWWIAIPLAAFLLAVSWVMFNLYRCAYPHLKGGNASLVYFAEIAKLRESEYIARITGIDDDTLRADLAGQIWRNSEIVSCKFRYLKIANITASLSVVPWIALLIGTSLTRGTIPAISG